jgi:UTP:GlnB (protein PII) uridylyltransferase
VHFLVLQTHLPLIAKVFVLAVTATILVVWVAEPSVRKALSTWLHRHELNKRSALDASPALWRVRVTLVDRPGSLRRLTGGLSRLGLNIVSLHVHPLPDGVLDELILSAPDGVDEDRIREVLHESGGRHVSVAPSTPVAAIDNQTRALSIAAQVARDPDSLGHAIAELLRAEQIASVVGVADGTELKVPSVRLGALVFSRKGEPFTPAESARAHRLAELAEAVALSRVVRE